MHTNFIDKNKKSTTILLSLFIILMFISLVIITKKYDNIEQESNNKSIKNLVDKIQTKLEFNHKIALSFSTTDEIYDFIENANKEYIYKNFRKGSYSLEDVGLSYFILSDKKNNIKFSTYNRRNKSKDTLNFEDFVIDNTKNFNKLNKVIIYQNEAYYLSKTPIYKTDYENSSNGFLYTGSKINKQELLDTSSDFKNIKFTSKQKPKMQSNESNSVETISLKTVLEKRIENNITYNEISFYNQSRNLVFCVKTENNMSTINKTKELTLIIFFSLVIIAIFIILYISTKYKKELISQNESIDKKVKKETDELNVKIKELEKANKNLYKIAHTDFLTKTMNRRNFFIHAQKSFNFVQKNNHLLSVIMIDIDNFKRINDNYGHSIGDKVLVLFAEKIKSNITEKTIFGRLGGEEFALVVKNTNLEDTILKAEKLKKKIEEIELIVDGNIIKITASFGVSDNKNCSNIDEMLQKADTLLYNAKESGRNLVRSRLNFC